jgi:Zn-dependent M32 family carboxypeptidase
MTERAQKVWEAYEAEDTYNFPKDGVVAVIRAVADRFATDWGELQHPYDVLNEIADEVEALWMNH